MYIYPEKWPPIKHLAYNGWKECQHLNCKECHGLGRKKDGTRCIHMISCKCSRCNVYSNYLLGGKWGVI